jgi:electron transfer flavoprotein-quinone oxidoreductase
MKPFDVIVVGAGPSGSTAALKIAQEGLCVLLLERGEYPGSKNMFGGMVPNCPIFNKVIPDFWEHAPWERHVVKRTTTALSDSSSTTMDFDAEIYEDPNYHGFTLYRPVFDKWYAERAATAGAKLITSTVAEDLLWEGGSVAGVRVGREGGDIPAKLVIACDGVLSFLAKKASLRKDFDPSCMGVGIRVLYRISEEEINRRFNLVRRQGVAQGYLGCTEGIRGGGYLYTQLETLSVGLVVHIDSLRNVGVPPYELFDRFVSREPLRTLLQGAKIIDYSAHMIPEASYSAIPQLFTDGMMVAGDAAALCYTNGLNQDGMNLAVTSGYLAAETALEAFAKGDFSAGQLSKYRERLEASFVLKDMKTFESMVHFMHNDRLFSLYPKVVAGMMERIYASDGKPKKAFGMVGWDIIRKEIPMKDLVADMWKGGKSLI